MVEEDVTQLLLSLERKSADGGREEDRRREVFDRLLAHVYPDLHEMAHARLRSQRPGHTLNATGLVHEAYLRLVRYQEVDWKGRAHFFGAAAQTMRRILVDHARAKNAQKRRGQHVSLTRAGRAAADVSLERILEIDDALDRMAEEHPRWAHVVECRYFAGMNIEETAAALGVSHGTVSNDWRMARAWLKRALG